MRFENKKGSHLRLVKTRGIEHGSYDLYDLRGLTLGKVLCIRRALEVIAPLANSPIAYELLAQFREIDQEQTIGNK